VLWRADSGLPEAIPERSTLHSYGWVRVTCALVVLAEIRRLHEVYCSACGTSCAADALIHYCRGSVDKITSRLVPASLATLLLSGVVCNFLQCLVGPRWPSYCRCTLCCLTPCRQFYRQCQQNMWHAGFPQRKYGFRNWKEIDARSHSYSQLGCQSPSYGCHGASLGLKCVSEYAGSYCS
jgi:hypothetical protein